MKRSFNLRKLINEELTRLNAPISKKIKRKKRRKTVEESAIKEKELLPVWIPLQSDDWFEKRILFFRKCSSGRLTYNPMLSWNKAIVPKEESIVFANVFFIQELYV